MYRHIKRLLDILLATVGLLAVAPILGVAALAVRVRMGSPVLFRQTRPGLQERPFQILKLRTMTDERDEAGRPLPPERRLTPLGKLLRSTSVDELPELINVLKGEMSLIGPRPLLMDYLPYFSPEERLRFSVRPGVTGLAQVNGRNFLEWDKRLALDVEYVKGLSFALDMAILLKTIKCIVSRENIAIESFEVEGRLDDKRSGMDCAGKAARGGLREATL